MPLSALAQLLIEVFGPIVAEAGLGVGKAAYQEVKQQLERRDPDHAIERALTVARLDGLVAFEAVEPWPRARITWIDSYEGTRTVLLEPRSTAHAELLAARIEALWKLARAQRADLARFEEGWLAVPDLPWEAVTSLPGAPVGEGAFRSEADPIVARRERTPGEALLAFVTSRPGLEWSSQPEELVLTERWLYGRSGEAVARLPLRALRKWSESPDGDAVATFGRRTRVMLPGRPDCPLVAALRRVAMRPIAG